MTVTQCQAIPVFFADISPAELEKSAVSGYITSDKRSRFAEKATAIDRPDGLDGPDGQLRANRCGGKMARKKSPMISRHDSSSAASVKSILSVKSSRKARPHLEKSGHTVILQLTKHFFGGLIHELAIVGKKAFALSAALGLLARHFDPGRIRRNGILPGSCRKTETAV